MRSIFLVGFMASGKTVVGGALAGLLGVPFLDLDQRICDAAGATVTELFRRFGEPGFRAREAAALAEVVADGPAVVATGGGAFCSAANRSAIHGAGHASVFLDVPWRVIVRRMEGDTSDRPRWEGEAAARVLFEARLPAYRLATVRVGLTGEESPEEVARDVLARLQGVGCAT